LLKYGFFVFIFSSALAHADCDFNTSEYLEELSTPKSINSIDIEISKSKKWFENGFKIILDKSPIIKRKHKKKYKAKIKVRYAFGSCSFTGKVRQTGDNKDHIEFTDLVTRQSLKVDLDSGNVLSATSFKLLLPSTRGGDNEIFGTLLLSQLGYIAPKTFSVNAEVNGVFLNYLFQENPKKELLERHGRREGPIFEGDESLVGDSFLKVKTDDFRVFRKHISGARLINDNWPRKSRESFLVTLRAFVFLQREMLGYEVSYPQKKLYLNPGFGKKGKDNFSRFNFLMLAMGGEHGLYPNNRKFYFNSFLGSHEPIYYDGNLDLQSGLSRHLNVYGSADLEYFYRDIDKTEIDQLKMQLRDLDLVKFSKNFADHSRNNVDEALKISKKFLGQILANADELSDGHIKQVSMSSTKVAYHKVLDHIEKKSMDNKVDQKMIVVSSIGEDAVTFFKYCRDSENKSYLCSETISSFSDFIDIMEKNEYAGDRTLLVNFDKSLEKPFLYSVTKSPVGDILHSVGSEVSYDGRARKFLKLKQQKPNDWFLLRDMVIPNLDIYLDGISAESTKSSDIKLSNFGLTGCLNFYNVVFNGSSMTSSAGACEDSINIVASSGLIHNIDVQNAFSDAVDFDFSNLSVVKLTLVNAGNDCLDVSGGNYHIVQLLAQGCGDKGVSVGEGSDYNGTDTLISRSHVGLASKDSSITRVKKLNIIDVEFCLQAFNKKPEFYGGVIYTDNYFCDGPLIVDANSSLFVN
jgi:hypothetical protein